MQSVMTMDAPAIGMAEPALRMQQVPLTFLKDGDVARVAKVRGRGEAHHHLENLGFVEGAEVRVVTQQGGNLIVEVKGTRLALDRQTASKVITA